MNRHSRLSGATALVVLLVVFLVSGCSSDDCPTGPDPGTGGSSLSSTVITPHPMPAYYSDMYAAGPQDLFITTETGAVLRRQGTTWITYDTGVVAHMNGIWGTSASNVYAVGSGGTLVHFNGSTWHTINAGAFEDLTAIHGTAADDIWVASYSGMMWHFDGSTWTEHQAWSSDYDRTEGLWGIASDDYYAVVESWSLCTAGVMHYDGTDWTPMSLGGHFPIKVHGVSASEIYFVTRSDLDCWYNSSGQQTDTPQKTETQAGTGALLRYNSITGAIDVEYISARLENVWALGSNNVFVVGSRYEQTIIGHYDGSNVLLHEPQTGAWINDIWGTGTNALYLAGSEGSLVKVTKN